MFKSILAAAIVAACGTAFAGQHEGFVSHTMQASQPAPVIRFAQAAPDKKCCITCCGIIMHGLKPSSDKTSKSSVSPADKRSKKTAAA